MIGTKKEILHKLINSDDEQKVYELKEYKQKRSLNANNLLWLLVNKLAIAIKSTAEEILIKQNINNNIFYYEDRNKKIEKEQNRETIENRKLLGEKIYNYLIKNSHQAVKQIGQDLNIENITKILGIIRAHNSRKKNEYKQILHTKQKTGKCGNNINIYYVEV